ncbi:MAG: enoyl-CoA hydratase/isomerase family protein [Candidatus Rokubacteria bacterium]|nr:enoyl-CoA hydratase/isomerase family protein [Candidatus Rokubacteria bacterium]
MDLEHVALTVSDYVATVTMNRPPVNAQNAAMRHELTWVFDSIGDRDDVRVAIFTGTGNMFSAGADVKERPGLVKEPGDYSRHNRVARECFYSIKECPKPVIGAVNGPALGAGLALMVFCDILLASDNAYVSMPEIDVGLSGGARMLQEFFPKSKARRMFFTGCRVTAQELYRLGVIEACVPREQLMDEAMAIAREIAAKSPLAIHYAKDTANAVEDRTLRDAYRYEQNITVKLSKTEDAREAQRAFIEKRKPVFTGR